MHIECMSVRQGVYGFLSGDGLALLGQRYHAGGHIDGIAKDIAALNDNRSVLNADVDVGRCKTGFIHGRHVLKSLMHVFSRLQG